MIGLSSLVPPVNQLQDPTGDGQPDNNARENCTAAVVQWAIRQLTGKQISADVLKDEAYGPGYVGPTAFQQYAPVAGKLGLIITSHTGLAGNNAAILAGIKAALQAGHPVGVAIPSDWGNNPPTSPYTHSVALVQGTGGYLIAMNPWGGFWQKQPESWWQERFRLGEYHELSTNEVRTVWTIERDSKGDITGAKDANGATVGAGIADAIASTQEDLASNALLAESYYASGQSVAALDNGAWFDWNAGRGTIEAHTSGGAVVADLYNLVASAAAKIRALQSQPAQPPVPTADVALVAALKTALGLA